MNNQLLTPTQVLQRRKKRLIRWNNWKRMLFSLLFTAGFTFLLFGVIFGIASVRGTSMGPELQQSDLVFFYRLGDYEAEDIVLLKPPTTSTQRFLTIKRIKGVPGDVVDMDQDGHILINGELLREAYAQGPTEGNDSVEYPLTLGENQYFVLGDHRDDSRDSRYYGALERNQITGRMIWSSRSYPQNGGADQQQDAQPEEESLPVAAFT